MNTSGRLFGNYVGTYCRLVEGVLATSLGLVGYAYIGGPRIYGYLVIGDPLEGDRTTLYRGPRKKRETLIWGEYPCIWGPLSRGLPI